MFHKCGEYNLSANKQTTVIDCHCELQTNKLDSTGKQQTNSLLRGCTTANYQYIFYCFTFTITCNYRVPSHIYLYCFTEGCFGFNSATWPGFPHTISSLSVKDGAQDESQSGGERSM